MTQEEVLGLLRNNKNKWLSAKDIFQILKAQPNSIRANLRKLRRTTFIEIKTLIGKCNGKKIYLYKAR